MYLFQCEIFNAKVLSIQVTTAILWLLYILSDPEPFLRGEAQGPVPAPQNLGVLYLALKSGLYMMDFYFMLSYTALKFRLANWIPMFAWMQTAPNLVKNHNSNCFYL